MTFREVSRLSRVGSRIRPIVQRAIAPRLFQHTEDGSGLFGRWILDSAGLPAYLYELDQYASRYARSLTSEGYDRRTHWHQIGNDRITGIVSNDGIVQLYSADRGGVIFNRFDVPEKPGSVLGVVSAAIRSMQGIRPAYGGGFGYIADAADPESVWATAYRYAPQDSLKSRLFGMGYYETQTEYRGLRVTRHTYAPPGDEPLLLNDVQIKNTSQVTRTLRYYEYWDVNIHQLRLQWLRTGLFSTIGDELRRAINRRFAPSMLITGESDRPILRFHQEPLHADESDRAVDYTPDNVFLAALDGTPTTYYTDKAAFFGHGSVSRPDAVTMPCEQTDLDSNGSPDPMPYCMVFRHDLTLAPGEAVTLRYAYGKVAADESLDFVRKYQPETALPKTHQHWRDRVAYFQSPSDAVLQRETAWHSYNLLSATLYNEHFDTHHTPQGSAYLFSHGADGAPRDQAIFTIPLIYLCPDLARANLRLIMRLMHESGQLPYAFAGNGLRSDAHGIHAAPSDLGLFFMLALSEYIMATGDTDFLNEQVVRDRTVAGCVRAAFDYLMEATGIGPSGLICIGDGDWDDASVLPAPLLNPLVDYWKSKDHGESIPNTGMALYVLPLMAPLLADCDPELSARMLDLNQRLRISLKVQWNGRWFNRSVLRDWFDNPVYIGKKHIHLQAQVWALISGIAAEMGVEAQLIAEIKTQLDDPSPTGAMQDHNGRIWSAISQLLTWGYAHSRPDLAWRSLKRQTFANHAHVFPERWFNIWSGPDAVDSRHTSTPGHTWTSPVTPMVDFPVMNANPDAMALLGLLRVCGIEPTVDGLIIAPHRERFVLDLALLRLDVVPGRISVEYRPIVDGKRTFHIHLPPEARGVNVQIGGSPTSAFKHTADAVILPISFSQAKPISFEVRWAI